MVRSLLPVFLFALNAEAQTPSVTYADATRPGRGKLLGGEAVGAGTNVFSGEFGWPSISLGFTHGLGADVDVGVRFDLLNRLEQNIERSMGFLQQVRLRPARTAASHSSAP
jgi:hypothetical protein